MSLCSFRFVDEDGEEPHTQPFLNLGSQFFLGVIGEKLLAKGPRGSLLKGGD
jgi:hypothetical protein